MKSVLKQIVVELLTREAKAILKKYQPKIIAITGTVGKTSTKDAIYLALSQFMSVRRSPKSFNSELGVPLTILGMKSPGVSFGGWLKVLLEGLVLIVFPNHYPKWLVLEVGTDRPGDIEEITRWLTPDIVVVTKFSDVPVHVEAFGVPEAVFKEKGNLVKALRADGTLLLNADDKDVLEYRKLFEGKTLLFGNKSASALKSDNYEILYDEEKKPRGISFDVISLGDGELQQPIKIALLGTLGESHAYHVLAALLTVKTLGEDVYTAAKSFRDAKPTPGRVRLIEGLKGSMLIDDSYNSSPVAVEASLKILKSVKASLPSGKRGRKIAILGDMLELGRFTADAHRKVGEKVAKTANIFVAVGIRSRYSAESALQAGMSEKDVFQFDDSREAGNFVKDLVKEGDLILIKGSQGTRMERVVYELMAKPEEAEKLLVRQEVEWLNR